MAKTTWLGFAFLVAVAGGLGGSVALADEPPAGGAAPGAPGGRAAAPAREGLLERALAALKLRMEAKLKEAELLEQAGRIEEALEATRGVERLYRETMDDLHRLLGLARGAPPLRDVEVEGAVPKTRGEDPEARDGAGGAFRGRGGLRGRTPGSPERLRMDDAVLHGLRWLAAHQSADGGWECAGFDKWCDGKPNTGEKPDGLGKAMYDVGATGLALCAFLGAGYTNRGDHEFAKVVRKGLTYLKNAQDPEGCFGPRATQHFIYNHAIAALAMVEAYGMTESPIFKGSAQKALDFIALARNPYFVWRYGVKPGDNDTSVMSWMMMALQSARLVNADAERRGKPAPLVVDEDAFDGIRAWVDKMTDPDYGRVGYIARGQGPARTPEMIDRFPNEKSESMTAVGMLARLFVGEDPRKSPMIRKGTELCLELPPVWHEHDGSIDMYYWYYATLALFQVGGDAWRRWSAALEEALLPAQRLDGTYCASKGSWDPVDPWGPDGGRVYSTALMVLCGEVAERYDRLAPPADAPARGPDGDEREER
jgi:hypothetical protein